MGLKDNLVSYWKLDEASGTRVDAHGSNDLTDNNTVGSTTGKINNAGQFVAANTEYLSHVSNSDLTLGDSDFAITAWVYADTFSGATENNVVGKDDGTLRDYNLRYKQSTSRFQIVAWKTGEVQATLDANSFGAPSTGTWYFIVAQHDSVAQTLSISINNGTVDSLSLSAALQAEGAEFCIGRRTLAAGQGFWDGRIDEVGIWKRKLTTQEITDLYNGGSGLSYDNFDAGGTLTAAGVGALSAVGVAIGNMTGTLAGAATTNFSSSAIFAGLLNTSGVASTSISVGAFGELVASFAGVATTNFSASIVSAAVASAVGVGVFSAIIDDANAFSYVYIIDLTKPNPALSALDGPDANSVFDGQDTGSNLKHVP